MSKEIILWCAFVAVALALFRLWWVAVDRGHMLSAMRQAEQEELDRPRPPSLAPPQVTPEVNHAYREIVPLVRTLVGDPNLQEARVFIKGGKVVGVEVVK